MKQEVLNQVQGWMEKLYDGDPITDIELVQLNSFLAQLDKMLFALGPEYRLTWKEVRMRFDQTENYLRARREDKHIPRKVTPALISAGRKDQPKSEQCPDGLTPDGEICPRCGGRRGPSGVDGGTWVHY